MKILKITIYMIIAIGTFPVWGGICACLAMGSPPIGLATTDAKTLKEWFNKDDALAWIAGAVAGVVWVLLFGSRV